MASSRNVVFIFHCSILVQLESFKLARLGCHFYSFCCSKPSTYPDISLLFDVFEDIILARILSSMAANVDKADSIDIVCNVSRTNIWA